MLNKLATLALFCLIFNITTAQTAEEVIDLARNQLGNIEGISAYFEIKVITEEGIIERHFTGEGKFLGQKYMMKTDGSTSICDGTEEWNINSAEKRYSVADAFPEDNPLYLTKDFLYINAEILSKDEDIIVVQFKHAYRDQVVTYTVKTADWFIENIHVVNTLESVYTHEFNLQRDNSIRSEHFTIDTSDYSEWEFIDFRQ